MTAVNENVLNAFMGRFVDELGALMQVAPTLVGDRLGLYLALDAHGPCTPTELAAITITHECYIREWLSGQAAGGYVSYGADSDSYWLTPEQSFTLAPKGRQEGSGTTAPAVLTSARSTAERSRQRKRRQPALIAGAAMIGLLGFSVLAGPGGTEIGVIPRYSQSKNTSPVVVAVAGTLGGYAPNSISSPIVPLAANPQKSGQESERIGIEPRWPGDDFSIGGYAPNIPPIPATSR